LLGLRDGMGLQQVMQDLIGGHGGSE